MPVTACEFESHSTHHSYKKLSVKLIVEINFTDIFVFIRLLFYFDPLIF